MGPSHHITVDRSRTLERVELGLWDLRRAVVGLRFGGVHRRLTMDGRDLFCKPFAIVIKKSLGGLTSLPLSQIGDLLQTVAVKAASDPTAPAETLSTLLSSPSIIAKLVVLSLVSLGPVLMRDKLSRIISSRRTSGTGGRMVRRSREVIDLASPTGLMVAVDEKTRTA